MFVHFPLVKNHYLQDWLPVGTSISIHIDSMLLKYQETKGKVMFSHEQQYWFDKNNSHFSRAVTCIKQINI